METSNKTSEKQGCCMGLIYYNRTMQQAGKAPICFGIKQVREGDGEAWQREDQLSDNTKDFKYFCLGYSRFPEPGSSSAARDSNVIPYCEGLEVVILQEEDMNAAASNQRQADHASGASGHAAHHAAHHAAMQDQASTAEAIESVDLSQVGEKLWSRVTRNFDKMGETLRNEGPIVVRQFDSMDQVKTRLELLATGNLQRLSSTANAAAMSLYDSLVKPVVDKLGGR